jgi:hypothetical protein
MQVSYNDRYIQEVKTTFLGIRTDNCLNWKSHIKLILSKLSTQ